MLITSVDNSRIKKYVSLKNRKERNNEKLFLVEGMHLCIEASKAGILARKLYLSQMMISALKMKGKLMSLLCVSLLIFIMIKC